MTLEQVAPAEVEAAAAEPDGPPRPRWWLRLGTNNVLWVLVILVALGAGFSIINSAFLQPFNIRSVFADNSYILVLAVGMVFVLCTAGLDLSVGSVLVFSGVIAGKTFLAFGSANEAVGALNIGWGPIVVGIIAGLAGGTAFGIVNGLLIGYARVPPFITTLGTFGGALGAAYLLTGGTDLRNMPLLFTDNIGYGGPAGGQFPYLIIIVLVVAILAGLLLAFTRFGRYTYAVGSNQEAARRVGIHVKRHLVKVYALMGFVAGLAGLLSLAHFETTTLSGHDTDALSAIGGCVIGGTSLFGGRGTVPGAFIGALIPATLASGFVIISVNPFWQYIAVGIVLIGAVYLDQWRRRTQQQG